MHREQKDNELFISNVMTLPDDGWKTGRLGVIAYDVDGVKCPGLYPYFVDRIEIENRAKEIEDKEILLGLLNGELARSIIRKADNFSKNRVRRVIMGQK